MGRDELDLAAVKVKCEEKSDSSPRSFFEVILEPTVLVSLMFCITVLETVEWGL